MLSRIDGPQCDWALRFRWHGDGDGVAGPQECIEVIGARAPELLCGSARLGQITPPDAGQHDSRGGRHGRGMNARCPVTGPDDPDANAHESIMAPPGASTPVHELAQRWESQP